MARVTVENSVNVVPNRFDLVLLAAGRTKALAANAPLTIPRGDDKNTVLSLREIEERTVDVNVLRENLINGMQKYISVNESDIEAEEIKEVEAEIMGDALYNDTEFVSSDAFQVVEDVNV
ncbi:MAG: DNA-directed RNA polymerase subunit omega [Lactobacillales bacterium]|jgi:DNA-directed RNA polymerase subunit omega|nr:DNA-directed RNA polymerase subunit omega [Lactobacillales bacterium]